MATSNQFISPRGIAKYVRLTEPYKFNRKARRSEPHPEGDYEVTLVVAAKDAAPLIKQLTAVIDESGIEPENLPWKDQVDKDTKKPTGNIEFKFKDYGQNKDGTKKKIKFFDRRGKFIAGGVALGGGSTIKVEAYAIVAEKGVRLNLKGVQVISLAEAESGFGEEDGDYEADEAQEQQEKAFGASDQEATDDDDDPF